MAEAVLCDDDICTREEVQWKMTKKTRMETFQVYGRDARPLQKKYRINKKRWGTTTEERDRRIGLWDEAREKRSKTIFFDGDGTEISILTGDGRVVIVR
jgi:hypothetical protein